MFSLFRRPSSHGGALAPILFIVVALALSAAVFFLFTKKRMDQAREAEAPVVVNEDGTTAQPPPDKTPIPPSDEPASKGPDAKPGTPGTPTTAATDAKAAMTPSSFGFARPGDLAEQLT